MEKSETVRAIEAVLSQRRHDMDTLAAQIVGLRDALEIVERIEYAAEKKSNPSTKEGSDDD